jgi:hypothetical protein
MYVARLTITPKTTTDEALEEVYDATTVYCGSLKKHGQIYGEEIIAWVGKRLQITLMLAGPDAHAAKNHSKGGWSGCRDQTPPGCVRAPRARAARAAGPGFR